MKHTYLIVIPLLLIWLISCESKPTELIPIAENIPVWNASLYLKMENKLGEGAIWNDSTGQLWHIDIEGKQFFATNTKTKQQQVFRLDQRIGTIVPDDTGNAVIGMENGIYQYNFATSAMELITNPLEKIPEIRFNDGKCDAKGRLWVGSMGLKQKPFRASLYSIEKGEPKVHLDSVTISNGIVWSLDNRIMYYIDTPDENVKAFDFDLETGQISNERVVIEIGGLGFPDGMTIDADGMLWIALWNGGRVGRWNPETGELIGVVNVPAHNITSCAFVGEALDSLLITSAMVDMKKAEKEQYPLAGSLFVVVPGVKGVRSNFYQTQRQ